MRIFNFVLTALALCVSSVAPAQSVSSSRDHISGGMPEKWNMVYFQYAPTTEHADHPIGDAVLKGNLSLTGLAFGYAHAFSFVKQLPLYLQAGGELKYSFKNKNGHDDAFFSLKIPVSITYAFRVADKIDLLPWAGLYGRYNLSGTSKKDNGNEVNLFDSNETAMGENAYKRLQFGWQAGCNVLFMHRFMAGVGYSKDLSKLLDNKYSKISSHALNISVGYLF